MAIPAWLMVAGQAAGNVSQLAGSGGDTQYGSGIGAKILGAPGDPAGAAWKLTQDIVNMRSNKKLMNMKNAAFKLEQEKAKLENKLLETEIRDRLYKENWANRFRKAWTGV
jgi:hypothetical protein